MKKLQNISNFDSAERNRLKYLPPNEVILDFPFILCKNKQLKIGNPYMKIENWLADSHIQAVRLLDVWDEDNIVYLKIQDLQTSKVDTISHNLEYEGDFWLWSLADLEYLQDLADVRK